MNDITYAVSVDVNNPIIPYNVYVASVLDSNVRYLEITLYQNGNVITLSNTATATASLVTDNVLVNDSVDCTISNNIITVPLEDLQRHGNLDVQVTVTEDTKVLAIPFPIQVRVTPNIAENAQINENSLGSYAEVVHEIAEARGTHTTLHDAITAKLDDADGSVKENNIADESVTIEKVADDLAAVINVKEVKSNKKTTLTGNENSNDYYPTTKAVADALRALEQTGVSPQAIIAAVNTYLEEHGITQSALYEMLDQTLSGDNTNTPALLLDNDNQAGDYILYYVDSEETRHELFNFSQYFYTKARVDAKLANKADTSALASGLAQKANADHTHSQYLTAHQDISGKEDASNKTNSTNLSADADDDRTKYPSVYLLKGTYRLLNGRIPTKTSDLQNDSGYLTAHQDISGKADASSVYTKAQVDALLLELGGANVAQSVADMTDTAKLYVLASTGHVWLYATVTIAPPNEMIVTDYNKYLNSSGVAGAKDGVFIAQEIPVDLTVDACTITFKNFAASMGAQGTEGRYNNSRICALDANKNLLGASYISRANVDASTSHWQCIVSGDDMVGNLVAFGNQMVTLNKASSLSEIKYIHIAPQLSENAISSADTANLGITISTHGGTSSQWTDTGIVYGGGNEAAIAALNTRVTAAENNIAELASGEAAVIPDYWQTEVDDTVSKIKALQNANGHDLLCFGWCSDMHVESGGSDYVKNIGAVAARVMKACDIPLFLMTGDMLTGDTGTTLAQIPDAYTKAWEYLSPIGTERVLAVKGNHDAWTGNNGSGVYYVKGLPPEQLHGLLFRPQEKDLRRVFGGDGSYFYVDNIPQKTRFICLNSQWAAYEENQDGTAKYSTQKGTGFGQAQLDWLTDYALDVEAGYSVIVALHVPPSKTLPDGRNYLDNNHSRDMTILRGILTAYCGKTTYTASYTHSDKDTYLQEGTWADVTLNCDFGNYNGSLLGVFSGHAHYDQYVNDGIGAPVVCITSAINTPYDAQASTRVLGTKDETAFDFVCVNRRTGAINLIRCGYGTDRTISLP